MQVFHPEISPEVMKSLDLAARVQAAYLPASFSNCSAKALPQHLFLNSVFLAGAAHPDPKVPRVLSSWFGKPCYLTYKSFAYIFWLAAASWISHTLPERRDLFPSPWVHVNTFPDSSGGDNAARYLYRARTELEQVFGSELHFCQSNGKSEYRFIIRPDLILVDWNTMSFFDHAQIAGLCADVYKFLTGSAPSLESSLFSH